MSRAFLNVVNLEKIESNLCPCFNILFILRVEHINRNPNLT